MKVVYGTDLFRSREYIANTLGKPRFFDSTQIEEFVNATRQLNLFGVSSNPVLIDGLTKLDGLQLELLVNSNYSSVLWEKSDLKITGELKNKIANVELVEFKPLNRIHLARWIRQRGEYYSLRISSRLAERIGSTYGSNLDFIDTELKKLHHYYDSTADNEVSLDESSLNPIEGSVDIFAVLDAVGNRDTDSVRSSMRNILLQDDLHLFLSQLIGLFRRLIRTKMGEQTSTYGFVVEKMKAQAQKWTIDELILQLRLLLQLEFDSKRGATDFSSAITLWLFKNVSVVKD